MEAPAAGTVVIVGQRYVGLPLAVRAVEVRFDVVGYDTDGGRVKGLAAAESYVEDVGDEALAAALRWGRYHPTSDPRRAADLTSAITVPTLLREGNPGRLEPGGRGRPRPAACSTPATERVRPRGAPVGATVLSPLDLAAPAGRHVNPVNPQRCRRRY